MLVDSHCHFSLLDTENNPQAGIELISAAQALGVQTFLNIGTEPNDWPSVLAFAKAHDNVYASIGLHPSETAEIEPDEAALLAVCSSEKVIAIGETGLDYFHKDIPIELQHERLRRHIRVAKALNKPLVIHTREARTDTLRILREEQAFDVGGVMHCFTETWEMAKAAMEMNFLISFSGIVTFKKALELKEIALKIPLDFMLVETDAPFLAPEPYRGKTNQPAYVYYVAKYIAELRGQEFEQIAHATTENFFRCFRDGTTNALRKTQSKW